MKIYFFKRLDVETIIDYQSIQYDSVGASMRVWPFPGSEPWDPRFQFGVMFQDGAMYVLPSELLSMVRKMMKEIATLGRVILLDRPRRVFFYLLTSETLEYEVGYMVRTPDRDVE